MSQSARIWFDRKHVEAQLLNTSAGGFCVTVPASTSIQAGQVFVFEVAGAWAEVRCAHAEKEGDLLRLGLERIRDLDDASEHRLQSRAWITSLCTTPCYGLSNPVGAFRDAAALLVICGGLAAWYFFPNIERWMGAWSKKNYRRTATENVIRQVATPSRALNVSGVADLTPEQQPAPRPSIPRSSVLNVSGIAEMTTEPQPALRPSTPRSSALSR